MNGVVIDDKFNTKIKYHRRILWYELSFEI
jgi:hypothetical protein